MSNFLPSSEDPGPTTWTPPGLEPLTELEPLVSLIIPSYNSRRWVGQAIDSGLAQTYPRLEIIVVDDGSTDDTAAYLHQHYAGKIHYIYQPNGGLAQARNTGFRHSTGRLLCFLDADDLILPTKTAVQVEHLRQHPEYGVVYSNFWCCFEEAVEAHHWQLPQGHYKLDGRSGDVFPDLLQRNLLAVHCGLVRRECLERVGLFLEGADGTADWDLWLRIAGAGYHFGYLDRRDALYRLRTASMSHNLYRMRLNQYRVCAHVRETVPTPRLAAALAHSPTAASFEFAVARAYFEQGRNRAGLKQAARALKTARRRQWRWRLFGLLYLTVLPFLGYHRLEKLLVWLIERWKAGPV